MRSLLKEGLITALAAALAIGAASALQLSDIKAMCLVALVAGLSPLLLSAHIRAQHALRTKAFMQRLIDGIPDAFYIKDADSRYLMVNQAYANERGTTVEAIVGKTSWDIAGSPEQAREWVNEDLSTIAGANVYTEQRVLHFATGAENFRILSKRRVENEEGVGVIVGSHFNITQWKLAERQLQAALAREQNHRERVQQYVQRLFDVIPMPVYVKDANNRYQIVNTALEREWGKSRAELVGLNSTLLAPTESVVATILREDAAVLGGEVIYKEEHKRHAVTGDEQFRVVTKGRCLDAEGEYVIICTLFDTTQWRVAERDLQAALAQQTALRERTQSFIQRVIDVIRDPFYIKDDDGRYVMVNDAFAQERKADKSALIGVSSYSYAWDDEMALASRNEDVAVIAGNEVDKELHLVEPDSGKESFAQVVKRRCTDVDGSPVIVVAHFDITRWRVAERELARLAHEDPLTGLANRRSFFIEAERAISRADRYDNALSVVLFDLDHFKRINDEHGHQVGDEVLVEVARRVRASLRGEDLPCRWGGEEFAVLLPTMEVGAALAVADRLREAFAATHFSTSVGGLHISASCGVAQRRSGEAIASVIARADKALYQAKHAGRNISVVAAA